MTADPGLMISLTSDEALVLFELLHRLQDAGGPLAGLLEHRAEQVALWDLSASLERVLTAPFAADYRSLLASARERLAAPYDD